MISLINSQEKNGGFREKGKTALKLLVNSEVVY